MKTIRLYDIPIKVYHTIFFESVRMNDVGGPRDLFVAGATCNDV